MGDRTSLAPRCSLEPLEDRLALTTFAVPGFTETRLTADNVSLSGPTAMDFSPIGELFVLEQGGNAKLVRSDGTTFTALTLAVDSSGERGLLGIAFDPSYDGAGPNTDYVYLYHTVPRANSTTPAHNQIDRFVVTGAGTSTPTFGSQTLIRALPGEDEDNDPTTNGDTNHNGGAMHFGIDGKLYVGVGDHNYDPIDQTQSPAQNLDTPFGKMLRLNPDGTNPTDNPFYDDSATDWQGATWALGLRNPFTFAIEPGTGRIFINDVGENTWEEINEGQAAANYGWAGSNGPSWEGFEVPPPGWTNYQDPIMAYRHDSTSPTSSAIAGGAFYPADGPFGSDYAGKYFYADLNGRYIRVFDPSDPGTPGDPDTSAPFATSLTTANPVDLKVDAAGNLYYLARGGTGTVYRISANQVVGRHVFYNDSAFDGTAANDASDDNAIPSNKTAYLPGDGQMTLANITNYTKGLNGIMVDLAGGDSHAAINASDFVFKVGANNSPDTWTTLTATPTISVRTGAGISGSDRVDITWNNGAIQDEYLEVQVLATAHTGLDANFGTISGNAVGDVFFFGNLRGETATSTPAGSFARTLAADAGEILTNGTQFNVGIDNRMDVDRSNSITLAADRGAILTLGTRFMPRISIGTAGPFAPEGGGIAPATSGGDAGISSGLAATSGSSSSSSSTLALPASVATRLDSADPSAGVVTTYRQLLEDAGATATDDADDARLDDETLEALALDHDWITALAAESSLA